MKKHWKVEELALLNEKKNNIVDGRHYIWKWENEFSKEEKIEFIDVYYTNSIRGVQYDNVASYLLDLLDKFNIDKETLPKDSYGDRVKTVSLKAWLKRNDIRNMIDRDYYHGCFNIYSNNYYIGRGVNQKAAYGIYDNIIDQWFHDLLNQLHKKEITWFKEHDSFQIKLGRLQEKHRCTVFNCKLLNDIVYNRGENVTEEDLDYFLDCYERLEQMEKELSNEIEARGYKMYE